jgi:hypothetical protein
MGLRRSKLSRHQLGVWSATRPYPYRISASLNALPRQTDIFRALIDRPLHYNYVLTIYLLFRPVIQIDFLDYLLWYSSYFVRYNSYP